MNPDDYDMPAAESARNLSRIIVKIQNSFLTLPAVCQHTANIKPYIEMKAITGTDFNFPGQAGKYVGKVRDVYDIDNDYLVMIVTDRISAFDVVLPEGIPYKGQVLNQIAAKFLDATSDIIPNWKIAVPDPMVTIGHKCEPFKVEMVIRGYLSGHAWREYKAGKRTLCGVQMPDGMVENQKFPEPIITPTTKAAEGHDEDISKEDIIASGLVSGEDYARLEQYTRAIFRRGTEIAAKSSEKTMIRTGHAPAASMPMPPSSAAICPQTIHPSRKKIKYMAYAA